MRDIEEVNLRSIRRLNQRGGRMLTVADLLESGTINVQLLEFFLCRLWAGDSLLIAAGPSGTGKTTLLGALLNLIPPGELIHPVERGDQVPLSDPDNPILYLAHEINDAPYYCYIWGEEARKFLEASAENQIAATLHAETLAGVRKKLTESPIGLEGGDFSELDLVVTMQKRRRGGQTIRRITDVYGSIDGEFQTLFHWAPEADEYREGRVNSYRNLRRQTSREFQFDDLISEISRLKPRKLEDVRRLLLEIVGQPGNA